MSKALIGSLIALSFAFAPEALAAKKKPKAPSGAERQRQFAILLKQCQKKYSGANAIVEVEWGTNYGQTGWWCVTRSQ